VEAIDPHSKEFLEVIHKNFLTQHTRNTTRSRGISEPSILDLVLSDEIFFSDIDYLSPLGKSDHSVLRFSFNFSSSDKCLGEQLNYAKGDYVGLCKHMDIDSELYLAQHNNIEDMWTAFK